MIPIVDGHHHIWRQIDLPWLDGPMQPRIFGPYEPIRRDYPIDEYRADIAAQTSSSRCTCRPTGRANASRTRPPGCRRPPPRPAGRTPSSPTPISRAATCARSSIVWRATTWCAARACSCTGTKIRYTASPRGRTSPIDPAIRRNVGRLADYGWSFDLQVFAKQMADAAELAESCAEGDLRAAARRHARGPVAGGPRGVARRHGASRRLSERRLEAFGARHVPAPQRSRPYPPRSCARRSGSSAPSDACSARTSRSRSCGRHTARSSAPISKPPAPSRRASSEAIFHDTAMRVYRINA